MFVHAKHVWLRRALGRVICFKDVIINRHPSHKPFFSTQANAQMTRSSYRTIMFFSLFFTFSLFCFFSFSSFFFSLVGGCPFHFWLRSPSSLPHPCGLRGLPPRLLGLAVSHLSSSLFSWAVFHWLGFSPPLLCWLGGGVGGVRPFVVGAKKRVETPTKKGDTSLPFTTLPANEKNRRNRGKNRKRENGQKKRENRQKKRKQKEKGEKEQKRKRRKTKKNQKLGKTEKTRIQSVSLLIRMISFCPQFGTSLQSLQNTRYTPHDSSVLWLKDSRRKGTHARCAKKKLQSTGKKEKKGRKRKKNKQIRELL